MRTDKIVEYILSFLLREDPPVGVLSKLVGYTSNRSEWSNYKIVIIPSRFFEFGVYGTEEAYPELPLKEWKNTPILFGEPRVERCSETGVLLLRADIIASTYFLISRYEEMYKRFERDKYGRFLGQWSLPVKAGFIHRPVVEEYGDYLLSLLEEEGISVPKYEQKFSYIHLTHDIDEPYEYHGIRSFLRALLKEGKSLKKAYSLAFQPLLKDRFFTFDRFLEWNREVERRIPGKCSSIFFYKTQGKEIEDRPNYSLFRGVAHKVHCYAQKYGVEEEIHFPMECSKHPGRIITHVNRLKHDLRKSITKCRYHYLACREPEDFLFLSDAGIWEDFSMGYPDIAGFRLGTCRPVHFILPSTGIITNLLLHPLTVMDCSLDRPQYMGLNGEESLRYAHNLILETARFGGEANLLFHNNLLAKEVHPFHSRLYRELLRTILRIEENKLKDLPLETIAPCPEEF